MRIPQLLQVLRRILTTNSLDSITRALTRQGASVGGGCGIRPSSQTPISQTPSSANRLSRACGSDDCGYSEASGSGQEGQSLGAEAGLHNCLAQCSLGSGAGGAEPGSEVDNREPNTFVDFLAPNPMVLSQRVEEPAQASRKRALPASEPPLEQRQVERVNHLSETRLTEQLVTHRRYRPCTTQNEHRPLSLRPPLAQNGASSKTIPRLELPHSRIKRFMKEDSCSDPLVRIPACLPVVAPCNPLRGALERPCPQCAGDWTVCTGRVRLRMRILHGRPDGARVALHGA